MCGWAAYSSVVVSVGQCVGKGWNRGIRVWLRIQDIVGLAVCGSVQVVLSDWRSKVKAGLGGQWGLGTGWAF